MRIVKHNSLTSVLYHGLVSYPVSPSVSYLWNFGSLAGITLIIQIVTGIFLAMHYAAHVDLAFLSVEHIMRDVNNGWLIRYLHANGASMFFLVVYIHIFRGLYYGSYFYPRQPAWGVGVIIFLLMILTAFMGYVLPWGQMSFWAATVITNLASAVPIIGNDIVCWLWGGFSVDNATLNCFFSLHYLLPFVLVALAGIHLIFLHETKSNNPLGLESAYLDKIPFTPYFTIKDLFGLIIFLLIYFYLVYFDPNLLGHSDNYIPANPLVTPAHIVPEWYFLPYYAILRSVPDKLGGVILLVGAIIILLVMPFFVKGQIRSSQFRPLVKFFFWIFFANYILLGWLGGKPIEYPFVEIGQLCTAFYFFYFILILPLVGELEKILWKSKF